MSRGERETLLALHWALTDEQFQSLKYLLEPELPLGALRGAARPELCSLLLQRFPGRALHVLAGALRHIARHDLIRQYQLPGAEEEEEETPGVKGAAGSSASPSPRGGGDAGCHLPPPPIPVSPSPSVPPRCVTERELIQVAQKLGKEWQEVGIGCLGLERSRLEQIREENPGSAVLQSFAMLREWRRRQRGAATAARLLSCLLPAGLDPELLDLLQSFQRD